MADSAARDQDDVVTAETPGLITIPFERDKDLSVYARIHAVIADVPGKIEYDNEVKDRAGKPMYAYVSHDAVANHVRAAMVKHGLLAVPTVIDSKNDGNRTELRVAVRFVNVDRPEDNMEIVVTGYGVDTSDKGPGKALSYAVKMALLKVYMLNTADDIEQDDVTHDPDKPRASQELAARDDARMAMEASARNLKAAIDSATTVEEIDDLQSANKEFLMEAPEVTRGFFVGLIEHRKHELENVDAG